MSTSDFEKEIDRQIAPTFIPDVDAQKHVIYKCGHELEIYSVNK